LKLSFSVRIKGSIIVKFYPIKAVENIINNSYEFNLIDKKIFIMLIFDKAYYEKF